MITFQHKGDLSKTFGFLNRAKKLDFSALTKFGDEGVRALREATPKDTGLTADSWSYRIKHDGSVITIEWTNSNIADGWCPIAVILQYGHATGTGGWVEGRDYINPAIKPIFDRIAENAWKEVMHL